MNAPSTSSRVRRIVGDVLAADPPSDDTDLIEEGYIDSLALVETILALEGEFGVSLPLEEVDVDDFRSIASIAMLVEALSAGQARLRLAERGQA
ncbi:MAG TPA: acyl carrier protein [Gaiellaceae bacterium]|nr:acyl carrier protein [Gaiellaceae bacterium]